LKTKQPTVYVYRIIYRLRRWKTKSERFFTAFDATEAFDDFYHAFKNGHVNSSNVKIFRVEYYDRFADRWVDKLNQVTIKPERELATAKGGYIYLKNDNGSRE